MVSIFFWISPPKLGEDSQFDEHIFTTNQYYGGFEQEDKELRVNISKIARELPSGFDISTA